MSIEEADRIIRKLIKKGTTEAEKNYMKNWDEETIKYHYEKPLTSDYKETSFQIFCFSIALSCFDLAPGQMFLDFGAGPCWITEWLNRIGLNVVAYDINFDFMSLGKNRMKCDSRIKSELLQGFVTGDSECLPFRGETFDGVICFDALHHMRDDRSILTEVYRILKPGGRFVIIEPGPNHALANIDLMKDTGILERGIDGSTIMNIAKSIGFNKIYIKPYAEPNALTFDHGEWEEFRLRKPASVNEYINKIIYNLENNRCYIVLEKPPPGRLQPVSLVITNYNGRHLLEKYLSSIVKAASNYGGEAEIIVADDCSTDDSIEFIQANYPAVRIASTEKNCGFLKNANNGLRVANNGIVILLNSDVEVKQDFIEPLVRHFEDNEVFSVTPKAILPKHGGLNESFTQAVFRNGNLHRLQVAIEMGDDSRFTEPQPCLYGCGGYTAYDKRKFFALGGFDRLFAPHYAEDFDIGYLAWKVGWRNIYEPGSVVYHESHATLGESEILETRNHILLTWKDLDDFRLWLKHLWFVADAFLLSIRGKDPVARLYMKGLRSALPRVFKVILSRRKRKRLPQRMTDREILAALAPPSLADARYSNAVEHLRMLRSSELREILDEDPMPSDNHLREKLKSEWHEWLEAYQGEFEERLGHLGALRNMKAEREKYLQNLFGRRLMRMHSYYSRARNWVRRLVGP